MIGRGGLAFALLNGTALTPLHSAAAGETLPVGGHFTAGSGRIENQPGAMRIEQTSRTGIVEWQGFSVGAGKSVHVENGAGATLNRVTGPLPSRIDGALTATGSLYLVNRAGIVVGKEGRVDTGGSFYASTHDIADSAFTAQKDQLFAGQSKAAVVNMGTIASRTGDVALIARFVRNEGKIAAPKGTAALLAGYEVLAKETADGDGRFAVRVGGADTDAVNTGTIDAANAEMRANGGHLYALAGNTGGVIKATGVARKDGRVFLTAGESGSVTVEAPVSAQRRSDENASPPAGRTKSERTKADRTQADAAPKEAARRTPPSTPTSSATPTRRRERSGGDIRISGGTVTVGGSVSAAGRNGGAGGTLVATGASVVLTGKAALDVSGATGGALLVGGDFQGGGNPATRILGESVATARTVTVADGARLSADGTDGRGGRIVVWSDGDTRFAGMVSARGTTTGGDAEVSGKARLAFTGRVDLSGGAGGFGTLLLDPHNLTISDAADSGLSGFSANADDSVLNVTTLTTALATANVVVTTGTNGTQAGDITVAAPVSWTSGSTLMLSASRDVVVNAALSGGAGAKVILRADSGGTGTGTVRIADGVTATATGGVSVFYNPTAYTSPVSYAALAGTGTAVTAYMLVNSVENLQAIGGNLAGTYALGRDIDAGSTFLWNQGAGFTPLGSAVTPFTGLFDGQDHSVTGLVINRPQSDDVGLFGVVGAAGTVRDVRLLGGTVVGANRVGALAGTSAGTINWASATGPVTGQGSAVGGLIGKSTGTVGQSFATGAVSGQGDGVGGLIGESGGAVAQLYASGAVTGQGSAVGGLIGRMTGGSLSHAYALGAVTAQGGKAGGLAGEVADTVTVTQTYSTGAVTGASEAGGLIGVNGGTVTLSYWDTQTSGKAAGAGSGNASGMTGLTTQQARRWRTDSNFAYQGWDFDSTWSNDSWIMMKENNKVDMRPMGKWESARTGVDGVATVTNLHQLQLIANETLAGRRRDVRLGADIDASETDGASAAGIWSTAGFAPLGTESLPFRKNFDGQGHVIRQLFINRPDRMIGVGLFGVTFAYNGLEKTTIRDVGVVGGRIKGYYSVGGLVGTAYNTDIINSYAAVDVEGQAAVGGLAGDISQFSSIVRSHATGTVTSLIQQDSSAVGGLVGVIYGAVRQSYATGAVTGWSDVGGLVGIAASESSIDQSYATGTVTAQGDRVGGLAGSLNRGGSLATSIARSYATGAVTGQGQSIGGLVGESSVSLGNTIPPTITHSYATGKVTGAGTAVGGFIGTSAGGITDSYWDSETTAQTTGVGSGPTTGVSGLTTAQARQSASYSGWDFTADWYQTADLRPVGRWEAAQAGADGVATITNARQLLLAGVAPAGSYRLAADLDAAATAGTDTAGIWGSGGFVPLGSSANPFTGRFDGRGHAVKALTVNRPLADDVGLFGVVGAGGVVSNLALTGGSSLTGGNRVGAIAGSNAGTITQSYSTAAVTGQGQSVGGLAGTNSGTITQSYSDGAVSGQDRAGGLVGTNSGTVLQTYATGAVTAQVGDAGGLAGRNDVGGTIGQSHAGGAVTAQGSAGGLVGDNAGTVTASYWDSDGSGQAAATGSGAVTGMTGLTAAQMRDAASFGGFDATVWAAANGTVSPRLFGVSGVVGLAHGIRYGDDPEAAPITLHGASVWNSVSGLVSSSMAATMNVGAYANALDTSGIAGTFSGAVAARVVNLGGAVTPAPLTVTAGNGTMAYGSTVPTLGYTVSGWKNGQGDSLLTGVVVSTDATATSNVGSGYVSTASGGTLGGAAANNYTLSYVAGAFSVTPAILTVTPNGTMVYGSTSPSYAFTASGWKNGQSDANLTSLSYATDATATSNVGSYASTASGGTLAGAAAGNYTLSYAAGGFSVTPATLTVTPSGTMTYGSTSPSFGFTASGWKNGQSDANLTGLSYATDATATSNVGSDYSATASGGTLGGAAAGNYTLSYAAGGFAVTPAALTVTPSGTMVYGSTSPTYAFTASGWKNGQGDSLLTGVVISTDATATSNVGSYSATASGGTLGGAAAGNYTLSYAAGGFAITPAALTVTPNGTMTYGATSPSYAFTASGWKNGQGDANLSGLSYATDATATSNVGSYASTASGGTLGGAAAGNYTLSYAAGGFSVTPAALTVTPSGTMTYGATSPSFGFTASGWKNGQGDSLLTGLSYATDATATSNVGSYSATASGGTLGGAAAGNYTLSYAAGGFAITPAALTVTPSGTMTYGATSPSFGFIASGWKNGQSDANLSGLSYATDATATSNVGSY
ncbi:MBG domain-containing protein, partial [Roseomonas genomospecies 6]